MINLAFVIVTCRAGGGREGLSVIIVTATGKAKWWGGINEYYSLWISSKFLGFKLSASASYFRSYAARSHLHTRQQLTVTRTPISYLYCACFKVKLVRALLLQGAGSGLLQPQRV
jgi:hypothetical protein